MSLAVFLDVVVMLLLVAAIGVAIVLNRRLAAFRAAKAEFEQVIERFNTAAARAEAGVNALKLTGEVTGGRLATDRGARAIAARRIVVSDRAGGADGRPSDHRPSCGKSRAAAAGARTGGGSRSGAPAMPIPSAESDLLKTLSSLR